MNNLEILEKLEDWIDDNDMQVMQNPDADFFWAIPSEAIIMKLRQLLT